MRQFGSPVGAKERAEILRLARALYDSIEPKREVKGADFSMEENPNSIVVREAEIKSGKERLRVAVTAPDARPPFEWLLEITSDIGEADYFRHYLVREHDVVLAQRKVLTPLDATEAALVVADLRAASEWLQQQG